MKNTNCKKIFLLFLDVMLISFVLYCVYHLRYSYMLNQNFMFSWLHSISYVIMLLILSMYYGCFDLKKKNISEIVISCIRASLFTTIIMGSLGYFDRSFAMPRFILIMMFFLSSSVLSIVHAINIDTLRKEKRTLILGVNDGSNNLLIQLKDQKGFDVIGFLDDNTKKPVDNLPILGKLMSINRIIDKYGIEAIVFSIDEDQNDKILDILLKCHDMKIDFYAVNHLTGFVVTGDSLKGGLVPIRSSPINFFNRVLKRMMDTFFAFMILILSFPLILIIVLLIKIDSEGPIFYRQKRLSRYGREFQMIKFRTMIDGAEKKTGPKIIDHGEDDPRITKLGKILRKTYLDEIPQMINIIKGDMSFVGPRPERKVFSREFNKSIKEWNKRLYIKPGLTGLAQINGFTGKTPKDKLKLDLMYISNYSIFFDLQIMFLTVVRILKGRF